MKKNMIYNSIEFTIEGSLARIILNRPDAGNTLNIELAKELYYAVNEVAANAAKGTTINSTEGKMYIITWRKIITGWLYSIIYSRLGKDLTSQIIPAITLRKNRNGLICSIIIYLVRRLII